MLKKIICVFLILMCTSMTIYAEDRQQERTTNLVATEIRELTYEEAIDTIMAKKQVSEREAKDILGIVPRNTRIVQKIEEFDFGSNSIVEVGAMYLEWFEGSFRQLNELKYCWSALVSSSNTTYEEIFCVDMIESYPTITGHIRARGTVVRTISSSLEGSLGAELEGLGFELSGSSSSEMYYRKTDNIDLIYDLY